MSFDDNRGGPFVRPAITIRLTNDDGSIETIEFPELVIPASELSPEWLAMNETDEAAQPEPAGEAERTITLVTLDGDTVTLTAAELVEFERTHGTRPLTEEESTAHRRQFFTDEEWTQKTLRAHELILAIEAQEEAQN